MEKHAPMCIFIINFFLQFLILRFLCEGGIFLKKTQIQTPPLFYNFCFEFNSHLNSWLWQNVNTIWNYLNNFTRKLFDKLNILELNWNKAYLDKYDGKKVNSFAKDVDC
jgi:hypothetical protein